MIKRLAMLISGQVQGIGFRAQIRNEAQRRGFAGYVQNLSDGSVELIMEGKEQDLKNFIQWCYNGVGLAHIQQINENWSDPTGEFSGFRIQF